MTKHIADVVYVTFVDKVQDEMVDEKTFTKKIMNIISVHSQRYQDS